MLLLFQVLSMWPILLLIVISRIYFGGDCLWRVSIYSINLKAVLKPGRLQPMIEICDVRVSKYFFRFLSQDRIRCQHSALNLHTFEVMLLQRIPGVRNNTPLTNLNLWISKLILRIINIYGRFDHALFIAQSGLLMLRRELVCLDSASDSKPINPLCAQSLVFPCC